jgi:hypothetical protein
MSQESISGSEQSEAERSDVAVENTPPSGAAAAGPDEPGRAQADAQVANGGPAGEEGLQPSSSRTAADPSDSSGQSSQADSQSVQEGDNAGALTGAESGPDTASPGAPVTAESSAAPGAPAFNPRQVGAARRFGFLEEDLVVLEALGRTGRELLERLAKADSDLGRRYSRLGRAEQGTAVRSEGSLPVRVSPALADAPTSRRDVAPTPPMAPVPPAASGPDTAPDLAEELARLRGQVSQLLRETQEGQAARESADAERFFTRLDPQTYPEVAGGPTEKLAAGSPQRQIREALLVKALEIRSGRQAVSGKPMEVEESLREALTVLAPGAAAQAERKRLARQLRLREAGLIARPTQRGGAALESPADRTARALEDWQSRRGVRFFED